MHVHCRVERISPDELKIHRDRPDEWRLGGAGQARGVLRGSEADAGDADPERQWAGQQMKMLRAGGAIAVMMVLAGVLCSDILTSLPAIAQRGSNTVTPSITVGGFVRGLSTVNVSGTIAAGGTFQQILPSIIPNAGNASTARQSLPIQNDNTNTDNCWVFIGPIANATEATSISLAPQQAYGRYWPNVPSDQISITCSTGTSDTF